MKEIKFNKTYLEIYGIEQIKKHLQRGSRYFKTYSDYANSGVTVFDNMKFASDLGVRAEDFPFEMHDQNGWNLHKAPTIQQLLEFLPQIESIRLKYRQALNYD